MNLGLLIFAFLISCLTAKETKTPVIGILSKPITSGYNVETDKKQVVDGPYVHFLEAGGAKVAYINYNDTEENLRQLFTKLNGVLIPGGGVRFLDDSNHLTKFARTGKLLVDLAMEAHDKGDYFPIWGTCLGYELIMLVVSGNPKILKGGCNCNHYHAIMEFTERAEHSRLFTRYSPEQFYSLATSPMTYNNHNIYVTVEDFEKDKNLSTVFNILATSQSIDKKMAYIAAVEGKKYPIYAVQFHPEKNSYLFDPRYNILHTKESIQVMQEMSTFFVEECRQSEHKFKDLEEQAEHLVYKGEVAMEKNMGPVYLFP